MINKLKKNELPKLYDTRGVREEESRPALHLVTNMCEEFFLNTKI
jgi:hypothetical protein